MELAELHVITACRKEIACYSSLVSRLFAADIITFPADLAREADHRIANNLSIISSLIRVEANKFSSKAFIPSAEVHDLLTSISARMDTIARLHRLVRQSAGVARVNVAEYLTEIAGATVSTISDNNYIEFELTPDRYVNPKLAATIGLFVCEALTNAIKYAHPTGVSGKIWISAEVAGSVFRVSVTDDGIGLPENFEPDQATSTGLVVMKALAAQSGGSVEFQGLPIGFRVCLDLPLAIVEAIA
ncbi:MAG: sensor histidine kinase [Bradyrhizobium sp.]|nr:MAG: sensor histidine kinase [Bradyrhizobium sp.]